VSESGEEFDAAYWPKNKRRRRGAAVTDRVLTPEEIAVRHSLAFHNSDMTMIHALCTSHELLRAEVIVLRQRAESDRKTEDTNRESFELLRARVAVLQAEVRAWRRWYDGSVRDKFDMIWAGGDEWGNMAEARIVTDRAHALDEEDGR